MPGTSRPTVRPKVDAQLVLPKEQVGLFTIVTYSFFALVLATYAAYLHDRQAFVSKTEGISGLRNLVTIFDVIEAFSPFHEFMDDADPPATAKPAKKPKRRVFTPQELSGYDGSTKGRGPYLAFLGQVFDVSKGAQHYGPGGGYAFFSGKDASRAFVTGEFNDEGLTDDVLGLDSDNYLGIDDWLKFYRKDYKRVGVLEGRYFDASGEATPYTKQVRDLIEQAQNEKAAKLEEHDVFPPCNSAWSQNDGHKVWCTPKSGGIDRAWSGVPRRLFTPGKETERCACIKDSGPPLSNKVSSETDRGDLDHPHLKEYPGCDSKADTCQLSPATEEEAGNSAKSSEIDDADLDDLSAEELKMIHAH